MCRYMIGRTVGEAAASRAAGEPAVLARPNLARLVDPPRCRCACPLLCEESTALHCMPPPRRCLECKPASRIGARRRAATSNPQSCYSLFSLSFSLLCVSLPCARLHMVCAHTNPAADTAGAFAEMNAVVFADAADPFATAVATSLVNGETGWVGWSASLTPLWCAPSRLRFTGHFSSKFHSQKISKQAMECPGAVLLGFFANVGRRFRFPIVARAH